MRHSLIFLLAMSLAGETCYKGVPLKKEHPASAILSYLETEAQIGKVQLCVFESKESLIEVKVFSDEAVITMSSFVMKTFSKNALTGALAHEFGHIIIRRKKLEYKMADEQRIADKIGISLVGKDDLLKAYIAHTKDIALAKRRIARAMKK